MKYSLWIALQFFLVAAAHAVVNIEDMRMQPPREGFSGNLELSVSGQSGNTDKVGANFGSRLQWLEGAINNFVILNHAVGETSGIRDTNKSFAHARQVRQLRPGLAGEGFLQLEQNEFARLSYRQLLGGGARFTLMEEQNKKEGRLGLGAFYSREKLEARAGATDAGTEILWRANVYLAVKYRFNDQVRAVSTTYYQPAFKDAGDYRLLEEAALRVRMNGNLDLKLSLEIAHDSRPPQLVGRTDTTYSTGIEYTF